MRGGVVLVSSGLGIVRIITISLRDHWQGFTARVWLDYLYN